MAQNLIKESEEEAGKFADFMEQSKMSDALPLEENVLDQEELKEKQEEVIKQLNGKLAELEK